MPRAMPWAGAGTDAADAVLDAIAPPAPPDLFRGVEEVADDLAADADFAEPEDGAEVDEALATGFTSTVLLAAVLRRRGVEEGVAITRKGWKRTEAAEGTGPIRPATSDR